MEIEQITFGAEERQRPAGPDGPAVEVLLGTREDAPVGVVHVTVPAHGAMPDHDHGASSTLLIPLSGTARLIDAADRQDVTELRPGRIATIPVGRRVRLENPSDTEATLLVVLSPPDFIRQITGWPPAGRRP